MTQLSLNEIVKLASDQFQVTNASEKIESSSEISDVFSPPHHGPRNVPIEVIDVDHGDNFTHFPIVNSDTYYLFLPHETEAVEVFDMHYNGPSQQNPHYHPIALEEIPIEELKGSPFKQGFKSKSVIIFNQNDPQPIGIHFSVKSDEDSFALKYIIV